MDIYAKNIMPIDPISDYKMHFAVWNQYEHPLDVYVRDPDEWAGWNKWRNPTGRDDFNRKYIFSLIRYYHRPDTWLFGGIFEVLERKAGAHYDIRLTDQYQEYIGRMLFTHPGPGARGRSFLPESYFDRLTVSQLFEKPYQGEAFPGYEYIAHDFSQLESIIHQSKPDWKSALESVKGIYLITDKSNGKMYVGSAYGGAGIWSRWSCYIGTGHGWDDELTKLIKDYGLEYARINFQLSLLEFMNMKSDDQTVIAREQFWKKVLLSREFGYNKN